MAVMADVMLRGEINVKGLICKDRFGAMMGMIGMEMKGNFLNKREYNL